jgi:hypothetical protein
LLDRVYKVFRGLLVHLLDRVYKVFRVHKAAKAFRVRRVLVEHS